MKKKILVVLLLLTGLAYWGAYRLTDPVITKHFEADKANYHATLSLISGQDLSRSMWTEEFDRQSDRLKIEMKLLVPLLFVLIPWFVCLFFLLLRELWRLRQAEIISDRLCQKAKAD